METIERELEEHNLSDLFTLVRKKEERTIHVNYAEGWLLAPFIVDIVKKIQQAFSHLDNLNTHKEKVFYETFSKDEAERILSKISSIIYF